MSFTQEASPVETKDEKASLNAAPHRRRHRRRSWARRLRKRLLKVSWGRILLIVVAAIAVIVVATVAIIIDSTNRVEMSVSSFQRVIDSVSSRSGTELTLTDFNRLDSSITDLAATILDTQARLAFLQPFARFNKTVKTSLASLDIALHLAVAAHYTLSGLQPTLFFLVSGNDSESVVTQISSGQRIVELLRVGQGQFANAIGLLTVSQAELSSLDLTGADSSVILNVESLSRYQDQLSQIANVLANAPDFLTTALGINGEQNYLVLSQNNDELRPSGGYLSTYGWMTIRNGRVTNYSYSPTTTTSPNPPPASFVSQLNIPSWWLHYQQPIYAGWDGSWFADFPSTAKMAIWYYNTGSNPQSPVNGAISIDITGFEDLLGVIGDIVVPGYSTPVNADNFRAVIYNIRDFGAGEEPHKKFLAALYQQIFAQWQSMSFDATKNTQLLGAMLKALQEKHIMMYFTDPQLNNAVNLLDWSGAQTPAVDHDYLMAADANLGNKSNHSIIRSLTYDVDLQADGSVKGSTTISYDYSARVAANDPAVNPQYNGPTDYNNLLQVFVPAGTTLSSSGDISPAPTVVNNDANTEFVTRLFIPFDSSQNFQFSYTTKPLVQSLGVYKRYRLFLEKQAGTPGDSVNVQVILPPNSTFVSSTPNAAASYNLDRPVLEFQTDLSVDRWIEIVYQS